MKICKICSNQFNPSNKRSLYCSQSCKCKAGNDRKPRRTAKRYSLAKENYKKEIDYNTQQVIYGSLLGDGCLIKSTNGYRFSINQCGKFITYLEWKKNLTHYIFQQEKPSLYIRPIKGTQHFYHSISHPYFSTIYKTFYPINRKIVSQEILDKIDALGLAIWYQDDGSFNPNPNSRQITLCTDSFTLDEHKLIQEWFMKRWKIEVKIQFLKETKTTYGIKKSAYRIRINKFEVPKLCNIIRSFIQPCMLHKLPNSLSC
jgi:hypothetical protein